MKCGPSLSLMAAAICYAGSNLFAGGIVSYNYQGKNGDPSDPANWVEGLPPSSNTTELIFPYPSPSTFLNFPSSFTVYSLNFLADNSFFKIQGTPINDPATITLNIGSGGLLLSQATGAKPNGVYFGGINLSLDSNQIWDTKTGMIAVDAPLLGTGGLEKQGTGVLMLFRSSPAYTGNVLLGQGSIQVSADNPFGTTGSLTLADGTRLETVANSGAGKITIPNPILLGNGTTLASTHNQYGKADLTLTGAITALAQNTVTNLSGDFVVTIKGAVDGPLGTTLTFFSPTNSEGQGVAFFDTSSSLSSNIAGITASQSAVVFSTNLNSPTLVLQATQGGVLGVGTDSTGSVDQNALLNYVLGRITSRSTFSGTLSLDTKPGTSIMPFTGDSVNHKIDLTGFDPAKFTLGSLTVANIGPSTTLVSPTGAGGVITFGGGGGRLIVSASLTGSGVNVISPDDQALTVVLNGSNTFSGTPVVAKSFLVIDSSTALPSSSVTLSQSFVPGSWGYISVTPNAIMTPADLIGKLGFYSPTSIIGFDSPQFATGSVSLSGNIDFSGKASTPYIGTMTGTTSTERTTEGLTLQDFKLIKPGTDGILKFIAVGGRDMGNGERGTMYLNAPLTTANGVTSVVYGHPDYNVTFGTHNTPGLYTITGQYSVMNSDYSGGTTIYGGDFQLGGVSPFGTGPVTIDAMAQKVGIIPFTNQALASIAANNSELVLGNAADLNKSISIGGLTGSAAVRIVGTVGLTTANPSFTGSFKIDGGTASLIASNNQALGNAPVSLNSGALYFDPGVNTPSIGNLDGYGSIFIPAAATSFTINQSTKAQFSGSIFEKTLSGNTNAKLILNNASNSALILGTSNQNYAGGTEVNGGALIVKGLPAITQPLGASSGLITLNNSQLVLEPFDPASSGPVIPNGIVFGSGVSKIAGKGTFLSPGGLAIATGAIVSPGSFAVLNSQLPSVPQSFKPPLVSQLTFFSGTTDVLSFANGGGFDVTIREPGQAAGIGYNTIWVNGKLDITTITPNTFKFNIITLDQQGLLGPLKNVAGGTTYALTLVHTTNGVFTNGGAVNMSAFSLDFTGYTPSAGIVSSDWAFALANGGNDIVLNFTPVPEPETWALMLGASATVFIPWIRGRSRGKRGKAQVLS